MEILIVTPEITPYSGRTELGALAAALPKGLRGLEHHVVVLSPLYSCVDPAAHSLARRLSTLDVTLDGETQSCALYDGRTTGGIDLLFIGHPAFGEHAAEDDDEATRRAAVVLCQAAAALSRQLEPRPEVVHALGFQAALSLPLCRPPGRSEAGGEDGPATVLSPANLTAHGQFGPEELAALQPGQAVLAALDASPTGNLLAAGMRAADRVVMDSAAAVKALKSSEVAQPLLSALSGADEQVTYVLSGLDASYWNTLTDSHLTARFDAADTSGKDQCKGALEYELGLPARPDSPLVAIVGGPLSEEECAVIQDALRNDLQLVVAAEHGLPPALAEVGEQYDDQIKAMPPEDTGAQHRLLSGADFVLIPKAGSARSQIHLAALRYGALPIASTGGPAEESLVDCDSRLTTGNGFLFRDRDSLLSALQRAVAAFAQNDAFNALRRRAMRTDVSWERAARRYEHIYRSGRVSG